MLEGQVAVWFDPLYLLHDWRACFSIRIKVGCLGVRVMHQKAILSGHANHTSVLQTSSQNRVFL